MVQSDSYKKLLEEKKRKFFEAVYRICNKKNLPIPSLNFEGCPQETENQLGHYHPESNMICVSERQLAVLNFEYIEQVAAHEVSHIKVYDHGAYFEKEEETSNIAGWKPPAGVVLITGKGNLSYNFKYKKPKIDKIRCNYHLCRKKRKLTQCEHCKNYYCSEHLEPYFPEPYIIDKHAIYRKGHPCPLYFDYYHKNKEEQSKRYGEALKRILSKKKIKRELEIIQEPVVDEETEQPVQIKDVTPKKDWRSYARKISYELIAVLIILFFFLILSGVILCGNFWIHEAGHFIVGTVNNFLEDKNKIAEITSWKNCSIIKVPQSTSNVPKNNTVAFAGVVFVIIFYFLIFRHLKKKYNFRDKIYLFPMLVSLEQIISNIIFGTDNWLSKPFYSFSDFPLIELLTNNIIWVYFGLLIFIFFKQIRSYIINKISYVFKL